MNKTISMIFCALILMCGFNSPLRAEQNKDRQIINIIPREDIEYGCGCSYLLKPVEKPNYKWIFHSDLSFIDPKMNIHGKTVMIDRIDVQDVSLDAKVGTKFIQKYRYKNVEIIFENVVTSSCAPGKEGCEVVTFDSTVTVSDGKKKETYKAQGDCGC